jgi:hypothetical protein
MLEADPADRRTQLLVAPRAPFIEPVIVPAESLRC